jgi:hypothetical protein
LLCSMAGKWGMTWKFRCFRILQYWVDIMYTLHIQHSLLQASSGQQMLSGAIMHYLLCGRIPGRFPPVYKSDGNIE